jgi:hypothetical protein
MMRLSPQGSSRETEDIPAGEMTVLLALRVSLTFFFYRLILASPLFSFIYLFSSGPFQTKYFFDGYSSVDFKATNEPHIRPMTTHTYIQGPPELRVKIVFGRFLSISI